MLKAKGHLGFFRICGLFAILVLASCLNVLAVCPSHAEMTPEKQSAFEACMQMDIDINPQDDDAKKAADEQADVITKCVKDAGITDQEAMVECNDSKYVGKGVDSATVSKNRVRCDAIEGIRVRTTPKSDDDKDNEAGETLPEQDIDPCYAANEALSWFTCPLIDNLSTFMTRLYTNVVEEWLVFDPQLLKAITNPTSQTSAAADAWGQSRIYANILFVLILFFIVFAQITGFGEGRYGLRAMMPRFIALAIVVNISYPICQIVVDLSNILGSGIADLFMSFSSNINLENVSGMAGDGSIGTGIVAIIIATLSIIVASVAIGPAFLMPIIMTLLGGVLTIFFTYIMLVVRQAAMIIMVVVSPIAIGLAILPGTKSIFDKWFKLFRGLILTYPLASLLMMGGNFASRLVMKVWNGEGFVMSVISLAICIIPITMLPKVTRSSLAALDGLALKAQNGITKFAGKRLSETRFANEANSIKAEKAQRRRAFTYLGKDGNLHTMGEAFANNRLMRGLENKGLISEDRRNRLREAIDSHRTVNMDRNFAGAQKTNSSLNRFAAYNNPDTIEARDDAKRISEQAEIQNSQGITSEAGEYNRMLNILNGGNEDQTQAAVEHLLSQGEAGRSVLMQALENSTPSDRNQLAAAQAVMHHGFEDIEGKNLRLANWSRDIVNSGSPMQVGSLGSYQLSGNIMRRVTGNKLMNQDVSEVQYLEHRVNSIQTRTAPEFANPNLSAADTANLDAGVASVKSAARAYAGSRSYRDVTNAKREVVERLRV